MRGSEFFLIVLMYCATNSISLNRGGSHTDSPEWLKN